MFLYKTVSAASNENCAIVILILTTSATYQKSVIHVLKKCKVYITISILYDQTA